MQLLCIPCALPKCLYNGGDIYNIAFMLYPLILLYLPFLSIIQKEHNLLPEALTLFMSADGQMVHAPMCINVCIVCVQSYMPIIIVKCRGNMRSNPYPLHAHYKPENPTEFKSSFDIHELQAFLKPSICIISNNEIEAF